MPPRGTLSLVKTYRTVNRGLWFVSSGHDLRSTLRAPQLESRTNDHDVRTVDRGPWDFFYFSGPRIGNRRRRCAHSGTEIARPISYAIYPSSWHT